MRLSRTIISHSHRHFHIHRPMSRTAETASFKFNHTMLRVKDPERSLAFYKDVLGMDLFSQTKYDDFTLYFLGFNHSGRELSDSEKRESQFGREGILELTHNHGTELDPSFQGYSNGNAEPGRGFGHIAVSVDDVERACEHFERSGVRFKKRLTDGKMRNIAFILDPDGYWIEVVPNNLHL